MEMPTELLAPLAAAVFVVAFLYSCVGHAGASGYIAAMALFGLTPAVIKPTALTLNILVATIAYWQFWRAGHFSWKLFWPFALTAMPMAFLGGYLTLPTRAFQILAGLVLLFSAWRFVAEPGTDTAAETPPRSVALGLGVGLGLLAGLTGTGGGIFLTPLLLLKRWARVKPTAAVSALFILLNSVSGLLGNFAATKSLPPFVGALAVAAVAGGAAGSYLGSRKLEHVAIKRLLAAVLLIAGAKLLFAR